MSRKCQKSALACYAMLPNQKGQGKHMTKPQHWWRSTNRIIITLGLLLCVALGIGGAYLLGLLELVGLLH